RPCNPKARSPREPPFSLPISRPQSRVAATRGSRDRKWRLIWVDGIVKLTQKIARLCSKERTIEGFGLSRTPVFSLSSSSQLSSRGRRLGAIFINLTMPVPQVSTCVQLARSLGTFVSLFSKARGLRLESSSSCTWLYWVGSGRVTVWHVSPIPPLDPYVRLS